MKSSYALHKSSKKPVSTGFRRETGQVIIAGTTILMILSAVLAGMVVLLVMIGQAFVQTTRMAILTGEAASYGGTFPKGTALDGDNGKLGPWVNAACASSGMAVPTEIQASEDKRVVTAILKFPSQDLWNPGFAFLPKTLTGMSFGDKMPAPFFGTLKLTLIATKPSKTMNVILPTWPSLKYYGYFCGDQTDYNGYTGNYTTVPGQVIYAGGLGDYVPSALTSK
jgi:hypothetical protein